MSDWYENAADLLREPDPGPTSFLVESLIVEQALAAVVGRPKLGKTWALLDLAVAIVTGENALGRFRVANPGPVLIAVEESGRDAFHRRLSMLTRGKTITPERLEGFHFAANKRVRLDDEEWRERLREAAQAQPWRLIAFDPWARVTGATDENVQKEVGRVLDFLRELRDLAGCAVAYVHHTPHDGTRQRGSSDLESYWESKLTITKKNDGHRLDAEHREAEAAEFRYAVRFDGATKTVRVTAADSETAERVDEYLNANPDASANEVVKALAMSRQSVLDEVRRWKERHPQGGSDSPEPPGTTPSGHGVGSGSPDPPYRGAGTTPASHQPQVVPTPQNHPGTTPPLPGDPGYLAHVYTAFEEGHLTEGEWWQADFLNRLARKTR